MRERICPVFDFAGTLRRSLDEYEFADASIAEADQIFGPR
jgi:hypothetical protein